ncbi:hypothetical protein BU24DRAFT_183467 [Aaosphaeria arxii CBS 175.79]|uniref:Uncharacterized protein n=1 Tax=Aaosphaeria arxii CBS 175.79 TaxID=1450172 RepID=A0A6A5XSF4_9PLEO|nr:uncharacterized protein BU24DRAFT_183467 [Aaosphaeria arxii CBS 175.79]KAF2015691.1 hypothetical protein BU24DRAFT_183467 [Aaosphaeria arxii CBS 175.79]
MTTITLLVEPPTRTMSFALNRKRSRLMLESDDEDDSRLVPAHALAGSSSSTGHLFNSNNNSSNAASLLSPTDSLKKTRTQGELDELDIIPAGEAWKVDLKSLLENVPMRPKPDGSLLQPHDNNARYQRGKSITVLCVQGALQLHYDLLCDALPELYSISPSLQAVVLCRDPSSHTPTNTIPFSLPLLQAVNPGNNSFVKLGLLHPLGGGHCPLDALVVIDAQGRRRLVLPFGWGAGRHAGTAGGKLVRDTLMSLLRSCVEALAREG